MRCLVSGETEAALWTSSEDARTLILLDLERFTESDVALIIGGKGQVAVERGARRSG
jgi:RNA polymerase sigma-70 factor, ECF subfamily